MTPASAAAGADLERFVPIGFRAIGGMLVLGALVFPGLQRIGKCSGCLGGTCNGGDSGRNRRETKCIAQEFSPVHGAASLNV